MDLPGHHAGGQPHLPLPPAHHLPAATHHRHQACLHLLAAAYVFAISFPGNFLVVFLAAAAAAVVLEAYAAADFPATTSTASGFIAFISLI